MQQNKTLQCSRGWVQKPVLQCEWSYVGRKVSDPTVCPNCSGFFSRKSFYKHKCHSQKDKWVLLSKSIPAVMYVSPPDVADDFRTEILSLFIKDEVRQLCCTEPRL